MTTIEHLRTAARPMPVPSRTLRPKLLFLMCLRCSQTFTSSRLERECPPCWNAGIKTFGTPHPAGEMSGM